MYYPDEFVDEVRSRNDIIDIISTHVKLKRSGASYMGLCPFHSERSPSFSVSADKQLYHCFGCGEGGNVFTFLMKYENITFAEALEELADRAGIDMPKVSQSDDERRRRDLRDSVYEVNNLAARYYHAYLNSDRGKAGLDYLTGRGISHDTIKHFGLGFAGVGGANLYRFLKSKGYVDDILKETGLFSYDGDKGVYDKFWNRVIYPIMDSRSHVIGFGGRVMGDAKPKYLNSPETIVFNKSRNLYGLNLIHGKVADGFILCEGYMDVIALHQAGFTQAVAALGTAFTEGHANIIKKYTDKVYLCFDSDEAGIKAAMRAIPMLRSVGISAKVIGLSPYKDPDELIKSESADVYKDRMDKAKNAFFFETDVIKKRYDMSDPESKTKFMNEIAKMCLNFDNEIERNNYIEAFAREYSVRTQDFKNLVAKYSASMAGIDYDKRQKIKEKRDDKMYPKEDGISESQGILLTWLINHPDRYEDLKKYIDTDDFIDEPYHTVAELLFAQMDEKGVFEPATVINRFDEPDDQSVVAGIFSKDIDESDDTIKKKAISEVVRNIITNSLDKKAAHITDLSELVKISERKKMLQGLHIEL